MEKNEMNLVELRRLLLLRFQVIYDELCDVMLTVPLAEVFYRLKESDPDLEISFEELSYHMSELAKAPRNALMKKNDQYYWGELL
jgi:hypothetical protein